MPTFSYNVNLSIGGVNIARGVPRTGDHPNPYEVTLPAGKAGTLSTRTDNDTGVATVASGHGITTSDKVDVYWSGGMRYGMSVTATTSTTISVDAGAGDNFPVAATAIVVTKQVSVNTAIDGDNIQVIGILAEYATNPSPAVMSHVHFQSSAPAISRSPRRCSSLSATCATTTAPSAPIACRAIHRTSFSHSVVSTSTNWHR